MGRSSHLEDADPVDLLAVGDEGLPQAGEAGKIAGLIVKIQLDC
jgi:hypothetical protein